MDPKLGSPQTHFHIQWDNKGQLDWECFNTYSDAMARAIEIGPPEHESFKIVEVSTNCPFQAKKPPQGRISLRNLNLANFRSVD